MENKLLNEINRSRQLMGLKEINDLEFLDTHWKEVQDIRNRIVNELPKIGNTVNKISPNFGTVKHSEMGDTWDVKKLFGTSESLLALANKISHMINKGWSDSVKPMLDSIVNDNVKTLYREPNRMSNVEQSKRQSLGKGHFRWNYRPYILNKEELKIVKDYFQL